MCAGDAAGLTVGAEGAANGAGAIGGAGFVAAEPAETRFQICRPTVRKNACDALTAKFTAFLPPWQYPLRPM